MATATKSRINISISPGDREFIEMLSKAEKKPLATKARELLEMALEIHEDYALSKLADERMKNGGKLIANNPNLWK